MPYKAARAPPLLNNQSGVRETRSLSGSCGPHSGHRGNMERGSECWGSSRAVARCGVPAGSASRPFSLADLAAALDAQPDYPHTVYVERDAAGQLAGGGRGGAARAAVSARLAPYLPARTVALQPVPGEGGASAGGGGGALLLVAAHALAPHDELLLWPDDALLARAGVPVLAPKHIRGGAEYRCDVCDARYEQPNPLKIHLFLDCAPPVPRAFWRFLLARLAAAPPPRTALPSPAAVEALAAAWGAWGARGAAGHACLYCGKLYSRKYGLKIHIRTHTGYKPLRCAHCARRFGDPSNLNKHVRLHAAGAGGAGGVRHACTWCGAVLARRRDLERHIRARHAAHEPSLSPALPAG